MLFDETILYYVCLSTEVQVSGRDGDFYSAKYICPCPGALSTTLLQVWSRHLRGYARKVGSCMATTCQMWSQTFLLPKADRYDGCVDAQDKQSRTQSHNLHHSPRLYFAHQYVRFHFRLTSGSPRRVNFETCSRRTGLCSQNKPKGSWFERIIRASQICIIRFCVSATGHS